jgi:Zn-finger nucleic acid-binding protein
MRQYERNGVHVDQCTECRGIFLDRGELERLTEAESQWARQEAAPAPSAPPAQQQQYQQSQHQPYQQQSYSKPKKKKSFFEDLFE